MRRVLGIVLLAIGLVVGNVTLTSANASDNGNDDVIRLLARSVETVSLDLGETGESVGDQEVFSDDLYWDGELVGTLDGSCTVTRLDADGLTVNCVVTLTLPEGQVTTQGAVRFDAEFDERFTIAITGGTGDYDEAHGEMKVRFLTETEARVKLLLE